MLHAALGMYHAEKYIKLFKLYVVKNGRIIFYKIIYINVNIKRLLLKESQNYINMIILTFIYLYDFIQYFSTIFDNI